MKPKVAKPTPLSLRLRELRSLAKMTQQEVSDHLGIQRSTYAYYETGAIEPPLSLIQAIAAEYRVTVGYLFGEEDVATTLAIRQDGTSPLDGARLMGECDREERLLLSLIRQLDPSARKDLRDYCYQLMQKRTTTEDLHAQAAEHIHTLDELFQNNK